MIKAYGKKAKFGREKRQILWDSLLEDSPKKGPIEDLFSNLSLSPLDELLRFCHQQTPVTLGDSLGWFLHLI
jgi:hypothetical protein